MFRQFASMPAARVALQRSAFTSLPRTTLAAPRALSFHSSVRLEDAANTTDTTSTPAPAVEGKGGLFGTGYSEWFALPVGIVAAIPLLKLDLYVVNEETQLAAVFIAFCVTFYTQLGESIFKSLDDQAKTILKEQNDAEDKFIHALEDYVGFLKENGNQVERMEAVQALRVQSFQKLNAAGAIKPQHDFKAQVERMLQMIALEEATVAEKAKAALMAEATAQVTEKFTSDKAMKKAALDAAIATIKGDTKAPKDPVQTAFLNFFQEKAKVASKTKDDSEEKAQRAALVAKMNAVAKNEGYFFEFDDKGLPKMKA